MKRILFFLALVVAIQCNLFSQIGIKGGLNLSSMRSDSYDTNYKLGFHVGSFYDIRLFDKFYLQPQILFSSDPYKISYEGLLPEGFYFHRNTTVNSYSVTVPILLSYKISLPNTNNRLSVDLGSYFSWGLSGKTKETDVGKDYFDETTENTFSDRRKRIDLGLMGGAGYEIRRFTYSAHLRYGLSGINVFQDKPIIFMLSVGYKL